MTNSKKEFFTRLRTVFFLVGIIVLACTAHVNFFLNDGRPFMDHDGYYFISGYLGHIVFIYEILAAFFNKFFPLFEYDGFLLYKSVHLFFLIPMIFFTYLSAAFLYGRAYGLLAAFFVVTAPDILNIFHKSEINFLTAALFSMVVYFYIRSNRLKNLYFAVLFMLSLYLFFLHHYSSLLYMAAVVPVYFLSLWHRSYGDKKTKQRISYLAGLVFLLLTLDTFWHWERYFSYIQTGIVYVHKIFHSDLFFSSYVGENLLVKYFYSFLLLYDNYYFDLGVNLYFLSFLFSSLWCAVVFLYKGIRKISFSEMEYMQLQFVLILWLSLIFLCSGIGTDVFAVFVFFAPLYVLVAVLNAGVLYRFYGRYAKAAVFRGLFFTGMFTFVVYGLFSLFYPKALVEGSYTYGDNYFYYLPQEDDYNIPKHLQFFEAEGIAVADQKLLFFPIPDSYYTDLMNFYFSVRTGGELKNISSPAEREYKYLWVAYDVTKNKALGNVRCIQDYLDKSWDKKDFISDFKKREVVTDLFNWYQDFNTVLIAEIEEDISARVNKKTMSDFKKEAVLLKVLPFDVKLKAGYKVEEFAMLEEKYKESFKGNISDLKPFRKCLVFIYRVRN